MNALALSIAVALCAGPSVRIVPVERGRAVDASALFLREGESGVAAAVVTDGAECFASLPLELARRTCQPLPEEALRSMRWLLASPEPRGYDNVRACGLDALLRGCHERIAWSVRPLFAGTGAVEVRSFPELSALGTHRIGTVLTWKGAVLTSAPTLEGALSDEAAPSLFQVVVRRDDTYVGFLTEQIGTPFVFFPARIPGVGHQTDLRLGADCAALLEYGRRRMGERIPYVAPAGLRRYLVPVGSSPIQPGDILHFGFQTAALSRDLPPVGKLDPGDLVIHSFHGAAEEVPISALPYRGIPFEVLRFPSPETGAGPPATPVPSPRSP